MSRLSLLLPALLLAGCASVPTAPPPAAPGDVAAFAAAQRQREAALGLAAGDCGAPAWAMAGRVALSNGKDGGSGRIDWSQGVGNAAVTLSAPVTRQSWTLRTGPAGAVLEGVPNGPLAGPDAQTLLRETTGWQIPVAALGCWLRGARAGEAAGQAAIAYGADGRPARIEQGGWRIDYDAWGEHAGQPVPTRLNAQRGDDRVRLIVDRWGGE
ncbi:lipoprotein insertase outer membrane protein LolB [Thermomonas brevis]